METIHPLDVTKIRSAIVALGISQQSITNWKALGSVPVKHCVAIEQATQGAITRRELRPDDWEKYWPDPDKPTGA